MLSGKHNTHLIVGCDVRLVVTLGDRAGAELSVHDGVLKQQALTEKRKGRESVTEERLVARKCLEK